MATRVIRYVDPNSPTGGNGTTSSVTAGDANRAFVSIAAWQTARVKNLVTADEISECRVRNNGALYTDPGVFSISSSWVTDSTRYIDFIYDGPNTWHGGWGAPYTWRFSATPASSNGVINGISATNLVIASFKNILINQISGAGSALNVSGAMTVLTFKNCLITSSSNTSLAVAVRTGGGGGTIYLINCIVQAFGTVSNNHGLMTNSGGFQVYNSIITANAARAVEIGAGGFINIRNSYAHSVSSSGFDVSSNLTKTTVASSDDTGDLTGVPFDTATFLDPKATNNTGVFDLSAGSVLIGQGTDYSSLGASYQNDIMGVTRELPWAIGAFKGPSGVHRPLPCFRPV